MAKLANTIINVTNGDFKYRRELRTSVSSTGIFSVEFPDDLRDAFPKFPNTYNKKQNYYTIDGNTLQELINTITKMAREFISCTEVHKLVICYTYTNFMEYAIKDGNIVPNAADGANWIGNHSDYEKIHISNHQEKRYIKFGARIFVKTTRTLGDKVTYTYSIPGSISGGEACELYKNSRGEEVNKWLTAYPIKTNTSYEKKEHPLELEYTDENVDKVLHLIKSLFNLANALDNLLQVDNFATLPFNKQALLGN